MLDTIVSTGADNPIPFARFGPTRRSSFGQIVRAHELLFLKPSALAIRYVKPRADGRRHITTLLQGFWKKRDRDRACLLLTGDAVKEHPGLSLTDTEAEAEERLLARLFFLTMFARTQLSQGP